MELIIAQPADVLLHLHYRSLQLKRDGIDTVFNQLNVKLTHSTKKNKMGKLGIHSFVLFPSNKKSRVEVRISERSGQLDCLPAVF